VRRLDGLLQGDYRTLFRGFGLELAELREYQLTDDVRAIDWYVTARMQTPYVRQYLEDREVTAWFLLDMSPSVDFGAAGVRKRDVLIDFVAVLARLLTRHGNRVGALVDVGDAAGMIPAQSGRTHVLHMIRDLGGRPHLRRAPRTDLSTLLLTADRTIRRRSLVFLVSDFLSVPGWDRPLAALARRHEVLAVSIRDPREIALPDVGPLVLEDSETGEQVFVDTHDRRFRSRYETLLGERDAATVRTLSRNGIDLLTLTTEGDMAREIVRFAALRREKRKSPAARSSARPRAG
jgi:uncharacterized protein (DUF58 family)